MTAPHAQRPVDALGKRLFAALLSGRPTASLRPTPPPASYTTSRDASTGTQISPAQPLSIQPFRPGLVQQFSESLEAAPICATKLADAIALLAGETIQSFDVAVAGIPHAFKAINALVALDCIDEKRSLVEWDDAPPSGETRRYRTLVYPKILENSVPQHIHMFRASRWRVALFVSHEMKETMLSAGCAGAHFEDAT